MENNLMISQNSTLGFGSRWKFSLLSSIVEEVEGFLEKVKCCSDFNETFSEEVFISNIQCISDTIQSVTKSIDQFCRKYDDDEINRCIHNSETSMDVALKHLSSLFTPSDQNDVSHELLKENILNAANCLIEKSINMFEKVHEAERKYLLKCCDKVTGILCLVKTASCDKNELLMCLKELTEELSTFLSFISEMNKDTMSVTIQYQTVLLAHCLRRTIQLFSGSVQVWLKHPGNIHAAANKDYAVKQMNLIVESMATVHEATVKVSAVEEDLEQCGAFVSSINQILQLLSPTENATWTSDVVLLIKGVVCHSLAVAHLSVPSIQAKIHQNCQKVLQLTKTCEELLEPKTDSCNTRKASVTSRQALMEEVRNLKKVVSHAILALIIEVATLSKEPLCNLIHAVLQAQKTPHEAHAVPSADLKLWIDAFYQHTDKIYHVAKFSASCSSNNKLVCRIHLLSRILELLDPEVVPAVLAFSKDPQDVAALHHLHTIRSEWYYYLDAVLDILLRISDVQAYLDVLENQMLKGTDIVCDFLYDQDGTILTASEGLCLQAATVLRMATIVMEDCGDQGLFVICDNLEKTIRAVKCSHHHLARDLADLQAHRSLLKKVKIMMSLVSKLCQAVRNTAEHFRETDHSLSVNNYKSNVAKDFPSNISDLPLDASNSDNQSMNDICTKQTKNGSMNIDLTAVLEELTSVDSKFSFKEKGNFSILDISKLINNVSLDCSHLYTPEKLKSYLQTVSHTSLEGSTHHCPDKLASSTRKEFVSMTIKDSCNYSYTVEIPEKLSLLMSQLHDPLNTGKELHKSIPVGNSSRCSPRIVMEQQV